MKLAMALTGVIPLLGTMVIFQLFAQRGRDSAVNPISAPMIKDIDCVQK
jgi:hypothetical protein